MGPIPSPYRATLLRISCLMFRAEGHWDSAKTHRRHPIACLSLSGCLWVIRCRAHSPASCKVFLEVYYSLLRILDAPHWFVWDLREVKKWKKCQYNCSKRSQAAGGSCVHVTCLLSLEGSLGSTVSFFPPEERPCGTLATARALETDEPELWSSFCLVTACVTLDKLLSISGP